jgi:serine/threonine-protein kinase HipA
LLYRRILTGLLLGNTDMHLKNFAMFHTGDGLRLTPSYDQLASSLYQYQTLALTIGGAENLDIRNLKERHLILLGEECGLSQDAIKLATDGLAKNIDDAKDAINDASVTSPIFKDNLIKLMEKRWNGTFQNLDGLISKMKGK